MRGQPIPFQLFSLPGPCLFIALVPDCDMPAIRHSYNISTMLPLRSYGGGLFLDDVGIL